MDLELPGLKKPAFRLQISLGWFSKNRLDIIYIIYTNNIICNKNNNNNLLECKRQALLLAKLENPPVKDNGRRNGYMELVKELWDQMGHEDLGFTKQNLRDQAA